MRLLSSELQKALGALHILLVHEKCRDDVADQRSLPGKMGLRLTGPRLAEAMAVLAEADFPLLVLTSLTERQSQAENLSGKPLEFYAGPSAQLAGEIFAWSARSCERPDMEARLRHLGQALGCLIYWKDAVDDRKSDRKKGRFNALNEAGSERLEACRGREYRRVITQIRSLEIEAMERETLLELLEGLGPEAVAASEIRSTVRTPRNRLSRAGVIDAVCLECCFQGCGELALGTCCSGAECGTYECCKAASSAASEGQSGSLEPLPEPTRLPCPACSNNLYEARYGNVVIDECRVCEGIWLDHGELEMLADKTHQLPERMTRPRKRTALEVRPEGTRPCPRCGHLLQGQMVKGVRLDLCSDCRGLWLDQGELNALLT